MQARPLSLLAALAALPLLAAAPAPTPTGVSPRLEVTVAVQQEVVQLDASGRPQVTLQPVKSVKPGDVLVYRLHAANLGLAPARGAKIDDPIPVGTVLVPESLPAAAKNVHASLDGGKTWQAFPATVPRKRDDGQIELVAAPANAYTHLRWLIEEAIPPGESTEVGFKVTVQ